MTALNPEIIKDTKSLISLYQKKPRFKVAFDKIVANNINATYHGRPVKLYVEVLKNVTSKYKQEYSQVRKIVLHDIEGKVGELFNKVNPNTDFTLLDQAYEAALKGKNILDEKNIKEDEIKKINEIEEKTKDNTKEKRQAYEKREEEIKTQEEEPVEAEPKESPEKYNPANQEEKARVEAVLNQPDEKITETETPLRGPSGEPIRNIRPKAQQEISNEPSAIQSSTIQPEFQQTPSGQPSLPSIPNIPKVSSFRQFVSSPRSYVSNIFRGGASAGRVVATGAGRAIGKMGIQTALKAGAGVAAKLGASALAGVATGGIGFVVLLATSFGGDLIKIIKWIVIILFAVILLFFVFQRGMKMNSLLPPYDIPGMGSVNPPFVGDLDKRCNFSAFDIFNSGSVNDDLLKKYTNRALTSGKIKTNEQKDNLSSRAKYIRDQAQSTGLNPAIFLGYWESESAFSNYSYPGVRPGMDLGCDPLNKTLNTFESDVLCAIGKSSVSNSRTSQCAVSKNINSSACQAISFQQAEGVKLPISTLKDFLDSYGSKVADPNNTTSDNIVKQNIVDLGLVQCTSTQDSSAVVSCPLNGTQVISCGSYMSDPKFNVGVCRNPNLSKEVPADRGHCGNFYPVCTTDRKKHSIDINAQAGEEVKLPTIEGQTANWSYSATFGPLSNDDGGGYGQIFNTTVNGHQWVIYLIHTGRDLIPSRPNSGYQSGDPVAKIATTPFTHLHVNIGKDPTDANNGPGWLDPESLGMCVNL